MQTEEHQRIDQVAGQGAPKERQGQRVAGEQAVEILRIGKYRVLFDADETTIQAIYIGKRETTTYRRDR